MPKSSHSAKLTQQSLVQDQPKSSAAAEEVLLGILSSISHFSDLFATAMVNKGMYNVFKRNELMLIRRVYQNMSPAAWELSEWCPPAVDTSTSDQDLTQLEHTPQSYLQCNARNTAVLEALKVLILERCLTFLRPETAHGLTSRDSPHAHRLDDAFYRIWCFCKIFGCNKGREDDVTGQLDWLKGGVLAREQDCVATVKTKLEFDISSVLLNAPDHFARGNLGGLSAEQLYDMMELWNFLAVLIQGFQGRVEQARKYGIHASSDVKAGDIEREEAILEEWTAYLISLGPSVVLDLANVMRDPSEACFTVAQKNGWNTWTPPMCGSSRGTFLKEPVARLYEELITAAALHSQDPKNIEMKETSRKRFTSLAAEIRLRKCCSKYQRRPLVAMADERPMSILSRQDSAQSTTSASTASGCLTSTDSRPNSASSGRLPSPGQWIAPRGISPITEDRVETFNWASLPGLNGAAYDTAEVAVNKIVEMGFDARQACEALRMTDMGDGLRVDRAVDLLLRQTMP
ncbi:hypothetical protein LTR66_004849 [Elasticomyces elasticus]|nr:hypothetical protein LTR66_004849 [Elasticomyces elasticus]